MKPRYWFAVFAMAFGCKAEDPPAPEVDPGLQSHLDQFVYEAQLRGVEIADRAVDMEAIFEDLEEGVNGQCQHRTENMNRVLVDRTYWSQATETQREFLLFHELGHCILDRSHLDSKTTEGACLSIMHSSALLCRNTYGETTRKVLLDELFMNN